MSLDWTKTTEDLVKRIAKANEAGRIALQPQLAEVLRLMEVDGERVPARLRALDEELTSEAIEAQFDNVPL